MAIRWKRQTTFCHRLHGSSRSVRLAGGTIPNIMLKYCLQPYICTIIRRIEHRSPKPRIAIEFGPFVRDYGGQPWMEILNALLRGTMGTSSMEKYTRVKSLRVPLVSGSLCVCVFFFFFPFFFFFFFNSGTFSCDSIFVACTCRLSPLFTDTGPALFDPRASISGFPAFGNDRYYFREAPKRLDDSHPCAR